LQNTPLHPIAESVRIRFSGADIPGDQRLAELENSLAQVKLDPTENGTLLAPIPTSPRWMPTRNSMRRSGGRPALRSTMPFCTSMAQRTASTQIWDFKAEGVSGLEIDHQLYLGALLDWEVAVLAPLRIFPT
jgi:hypothetical protein